MSSDTDYQISNEEILESLYDYITNIREESQQFSCTHDYNSPMFISHIQDFIQFNKMNSVVDLGCGIFDHYAQDILEKLPNISYLGIDIDEKIIQYNQLSYSTLNPNHQFLCLDILQNIDEIPSADVCIIKDLLCFLPFSKIKSFLQFLIQSNRFRVIILCNPNYQYNHYIEEFVSDYDFSNQPYIPLSKKFKPIADLPFKYWFEFSQKEVSIYTTFPILNRVI